MKTRSRILTLVAGVTLVGLAVSLVWAADDGGQPAADDGGQPAADEKGTAWPERPPVESVTVGQQVHRGPGSVMKPPPEGFEPTIDVEQAADIAWRDGAIPGEPKTSRAELVLYTTWIGKPYEDAPMWVITYPDGCVYPRGGERPPGAPECVIQDVHVWVDAITGEYNSTNTP